MSCFKPNYVLKYVFHLPGDYIEYTKGSSSKVFKVSKDKTFAYRFLNGDKFNEKYKNGLLSDNLVLDEGFEISSIPCGHCLGCQIDYSKQWASRCFVESLQFSDNYFITLTYNKENVKYSDMSNKTLSIDDFNKFMKDLRNYFKRHFNHDNIRFFACGEYGTGTARPHYHIILFNCPIPDLNPVFDYIDDDGTHIITTKVKNGNIYYDSKILKSIWNKGNVVIGKCEAASCAYVARYCTKKLYGNDKKVYDALGIIPPFLRMSRMPGIGSTFFNENIDDIYFYNGYVVNDKGKSHYVSPGRFCDRLLQKIDEIKFNDIKDLRKVKMLDQIKTKLHLSNLSYIEQLDAEYDSFKKKIASLHRSL